MTVIRGLKMLLGSVMFAGLLYAFVAAPGLLSDSASTVPSRHRVATVCP